MCAPQETHTHVARMRRNGNASVWGTLSWESMKTMARDYFDSFLGIAIPHDCHCSTIEVISSLIALQKKSRMLTRKDFANCVAEKRRISQVQNSLDHLRKTILDIAPYDIASFLKTNFVASLWDQGRLQYKDSMWIGFAHRKFKNARYTVQFQFGIDSHGIWSNGIWLDKNAENGIRYEAIRRLRSRQHEFLRIMETLPRGYYVKIHRSPVLKEPIPVDKLDLPILREVLKEAARSGVHFTVSLEMSKTTAINLEEDLSPYLLRNFMRLLPVYSLMTGIRAVDGGKAIDKPMPVETDQDLLDFVRRRLRGLKVATTETKQRDLVKRFRKLVAYERNWEAQERASKGHRRIVTLLMSQIRQHGIVPQASDIDLLARTRKGTFIFEVKTIHAKNYIKQTRNAIGQLLDYEYFEVKRRLDSRRRQVTRGVVYDRKPPQDIIDFLRTYDFQVYWLKNNEITGESASLNALKRFLGPIRK